MNRFDRNLELMDGLETEYLRIMYYDFDSYYSDKYRSYEYNRLCTIINGEKKVKINNEDTITYSKDQFILLKPNSDVNMEITKPTRAMVLELSDRLITQINDKINLDFEDEVNISEISIPVIKDSDISHAVNRLALTASSSDKNKEFIIDLYAQEITYNLFKNRVLHNSTNEKSISDIQKAICLMKEHILDNITVSEIAFTLNMSLTNFSMKFKKAVGISPNSYLTNLKLTKAQELLKVKNVTEVAYILGYENISHFIKLYKNKFGITPKQYSLKYNDTY